MYKEPKNKTRSIREKYRRRLDNMTLALNNYKYAANERLINGGNIRNRHETKIILEEVQKLINLLPKKTDEPDIEGLNNILNSLGEECLTNDEVSKLQN